MKSNLTEKWIVCRVCLKQPKETMNTIFDTNDNNDLTQMILECGGVPIKKFDHYPDKICGRCLRYLRVAYKFRVMCQRSHKHLSRFIAPVVVERIPIDTNDLIAEESDAMELKMEPDAIINIKEEQNELIDEEDIMDMYEPLEIDNVEEFDEIDNVDEFIDCEEINIVEAVITEETEYLDDIVKAETEGEGQIEYAGNTSDADYVPNEKVKPEKRGRKPINRNDENSLKASTSRGVQKTKTTKSPKREPKRKYKSKECIQYICDICGNIYPSQGRLTEHIKLHKGIKPHDCE
ncbi:uncharacterized protein LOC119677360 [Teleopsis dalmanni]|nr:uncharacterized protein LOC119677360 [Teleopsis dalmanni]